MSMHTTEYLGAIELFFWAEHKLGREITSKMLLMLSLLVATGGFSGS